MALVKVSKTEAVDHLIAAAQVRFEEIILSEVIVIIQ